MIERWNKQYNKHLNKLEGTKFQENDSKAAYLLISFSHGDTLDLVRDKETS